MACETKGNIGNDEPGIVSGDARKARGYAFLSFRCGEKCVARKSYEEVCDCEYSGAGERGQIRFADLYSP